MSSLRNTSETQTAWGRLSACFRVISGLKGHLWSSGVSLWQIQLQAENTYIQAENTNTKRKYKYKERIQLQRDIKKLNN